MESNDTKIQLFVCDRHSLKAFIYTPMQKEIELTKNLKLPFEAAAVCISDDERIKDVLVHFVCKKNPIVSCISANDGHLFFRQLHNSLEKWQPFTCLTV